MARPATTGSLADPEFRHRRAQNAAAARTTIDYHISKVVAAAPTLTAEQLARIRSLLPPASEKEAADA